MPNRTTTSPALGNLLSLTVTKFGQYTSVLLTKLPVKAKTNNQPEVWSSMPILGAHSSILIIMSAIRMHTPPLHAYFPGPNESLMEPEQR